MKKISKGLVVIMAIGILATILSACGREKTPLSKEEVLVSLEADFGLKVETVFLEFKVTRTGDLKLLFFGEMNDKLTLCGDPSDGYNVLYIMTDKDEHKFIYYVPNLVNRGGMKFTAKDGICVTAYPFENTIEDIFDKTQLIADSTLQERLTYSILNDFSGFASFYSIVKSHSIRYVFEDTYFFVFGTTSKTYMVMFKNELYIIENQKCIYPKSMSIAEMIILFDNN